MATRLLVGMFTPAIRATPILLGNVHRGAIPWGVAPERGNIVGIAGESTARAGRGGGARGGGARGGGARGGGARGGDARAGGARAGGARVGGARPGRCASRRCASRR